MMDPETAARWAREAEALEEGLEVSPIASRPPHQRVQQLALEHERHQGRLRWTTILSTSAGVVALLIFFGTGVVAFLVATAAFLLADLACMFVAVRSARSFKASVGEPVRPSRARAPA